MTCLAVGLTPDPLARRIIDLGSPQAIMKLGAYGCVAVVDCEALTQAAVDTRPVDTVGAGHIREFLDGNVVPQRLLTAAWAGVFAGAVPGDWEGMPRRSELELLETTEPVIC